MGKTEEGLLGVNRAKWGVGHGAGGQSGDHPGQPSGTCRSPLVRKALRIASEWKEGTTAAAV